MGNFIFVQCEHLPLLLQVFIVAIDNFTYSAEATIGGVL